MKIVILGAGAVGCYTGAALASGGADVTLITRPAIEAELRVANRIRLTDYHDREMTVALPEISTQPDALADADIIILTVKCLAMSVAAAQIGRHARPDVPVLALQNGIGSDELLAQLPNPVIPGVVGFNVAPLGEGRFHRGTEGGIHTAPFSRAEALQQALAVADIEFMTTDHFEALRWAKLQLNLNNAICAISNLPLKQELETRDYRKVLSMAMSELLQVTSKKKLALPKLTKLPAHLLPRLIRVPDFIFRRLASSMLAIDPQARSSMWEDLHKQRPTEVDFINGAVVRAAKTMGSDAPANHTLCQLIHDIERGYRKPGISGKDLLLEIKKRR